MEFKVGVCETCKHFSCDTFDPSPSGVALGKGWMNDCGCTKEDELFQIAGDWENFDKLGNDEENQCPLWEPNFQWCKTHKVWYLYECDRCIEEMEEAYKEFQLNL